MQLTALGALVLMGTNLLLFIVYLSVMVFIYLSWFMVWQVWADDDADDEVLAMVVRTGVQHLLLS